MTYKGGASSAFGFGIGQAWDLLIYNDLKANSKANQNTFVNVKNGNIN